jgi:hypothetical protein
VRGIALSVSYGGDLRFAPSREQSQLSVARRQNRQKHRQLYFKIADACVGNDDFILNSPTAGLAATNLS